MGKNGHKKAMRPPRQRGCPQSKMAAPTPSLPPTQDVLSNPNMAAPTQDGRPQPSVAPTQDGCSQCEMSASIQDGCPHATCPPPTQDGCPHTQAKMAAPAPPVPPSSQERKAGSGWAEGVAAAQRLLLRGRWCRSGRPGCGGRNSAAPSRPIRTTPSAGPPGARTTAPLSAPPAPPLVAAGRKGRGSATPRPIGEGPAPRWPPERQRELSEVAA